jgi:hypothetical protein
MKIHLFLLLIDRYENHTLIFSYIVMHLKWNWTGRGLLSVMRLDGRFLHPCPRTGMTNVCFYVRTWSADIMRERAIQRYSQINPYLLGWEERKEKGTIHVKEREERMTTWGLLVDQVNVRTPVNLPKSVSDLLENGHWEHFSD